MDLIKGRKNSAEEHSTVTEDLEEVKVQIQAMLQKVYSKAYNQSLITICPLPPPPPTHTHKSLVCHCS